MRFSSSSTLALAATTALYYTSSSSSSSANAFTTPFVVQQHQRQAATSSAFGIVLQQTNRLSSKSTTTHLNMAAETKLSQDELKKQVGYKAVDDYVKSGMVVGLGTGSTAYFAVERVGELLKSGELKDVICIPTSERTKEQALSLDIPLVTLDTHSKLDVAIDGADEVDPDLNLVKGGGGALLREKMVEVMADKFIVIVDESKLTDGLGPGFPVPVEITPFCHEHTMRQVAALPSCEGCKPVLRMGSSSNNQVDGDEIAVTDNGNYIVDLHFTESIKDARKMATDIKNVCGVVDHGLFCDMSTAVIIAGSDGISVKK
mmetsp:Transcript_4503/g.11330  ORF Transcript_4503/g.11330 Transcript_4503/m.11330 type:complete len:317 (-) Transcript_4503:3306-4256(-)